MNDQLSKTIGYDLARRSGVEALHKTLVSRTKPLEDGIAEDLNFLFNQAGVAGVTVAHTVAMARMQSYLKELAMAFGALSRFGFVFESLENPDGTKSLSVRKTTA